MSTTLLPPSDDNSEDSEKPLEARKGKTIKPLGQAATSGDLDIPGASDDLLDELRQKTAALAAKMSDKNVPKKHKTLDLKDGAEKDTDELLKELKEEKTTPKEKEADTTSTAEELPKVNPAVSMVRDKVNRLYAKEPDAAEEALESYHAGKRRTKHQKFMYELTTSGKSLADIQTEWHNYYVDLPDHEKHEVWQEFYAQQSSIRFGRQPSLEEIAEGTANKKDQEQKGQSSKGGRSTSKKKTHSSRTSADPRTTGDIKNQIYDKISAGGKLNAVHHAKSLLFGLSLSALVFLVMSFVFFNEAYIAPFVSPGQTVSATPIIGNQTTEVGPEPKIIIPKINLEVPVVFDMNSIREADVQNALEDGVVHYASTPNPGEIGNSVIVGHSSNNLLNSGKYKFAFVLLKRLEAEDTFFVHRNGVRYTYKVYKKEIVRPDNLSVLQTQERPNTMTLITCDPPGTSINRLIITAEQISPDPAGNTESTAPELEVDESEPLPSNAPTLWSRLNPFD